MQEEETGNEFNIIGANGFVPIPLGKLRPQSFQHLRALRMSLVIKFTTQFFVFFIQNGPQTKAKNSICFSVGGKSGGVRHTER